MIFFIHSKIYHKSNSLEKLVEKEYDYLGPDFVCKYFIKLPYCLDVYTPGNSSIQDFNIEISNSTTLLMFFINFYLLKLSNKILLKG